MGKRMDESRARAAARAAAPAAPRVDANAIPGAPEEKVVYAPTKTMANCGNPMCCRRYSPEAMLLDGTPYTFRNLETLPPICGGDFWQPMSESVRKQRTGTPAGLAQFIKKPDERS